MEKLLGRFEKRRNLISRPRPSWGEGELNFLFAKKNKRQEERGGDSNLSKGEEGEEKKGYSPKIQPRKRDVTQGLASRFFGGGRGGGTSPLLLENRKLLRAL